MSEDTTKPAAEGESRALQTVKPGRIIAQSDTPIWDTAAFEHMGRVGALMADSGMCSETILTDDIVDERGNKQTVPAERAVVVARCVMVADLARDCGANPLMFLQGVSRIGRKLHIEGKNVNAIIRARTGVTLKFRFGVWDKDHIEFPPMIPLLDGAGEPVIGEDGKPVMVPDDAFFHGVGERLAVRVLDPKDPERFVDGSVGLWKTDRKGSPWSNPNNWRRQLRYRGAPEWARAYEPGAILGIYSDADEELDEFQPTTGRRPKRDLAERLTGATHGGEHGAEGFDREHIARETGTASGGDDAVEVEDENADAVDAQVEDVNQGEAQNTETEVQADDLEAKAEELARISPADEEAEVILDRLIEARERGETITDGHAEEGEKYMLAGDTISDAGRRMIYADGVRFSTVGEKGQAGLKVYAIHAPEKVAEEGEGEGGEPAQNPTETDGVQAAEPERASSETVTPASDAGAETPASGPSTQPAAETQADAAPAASDGSFLGSLAAMTSWAQIKPAFIAMNKTVEWVAASAVDQDEVRRAVWEHVLRVKNNHGDPVDHADDVTAFTVWISTQPKTRDGADAIEGTFRTLKAGPAFAKLSPDNQGKLSDKVAGVLTSIRG